MRNSQTHPTFHETGLHVVEWLHCDTCGGQWCYLGWKIFGALALLGRKEEPADWGLLPVQILPHPDQRHLR